MSLDKRGSGVLLHISSLPGSYGIGTLGKEAFKFIDFLKESKQTYLQVLPICPPFLGNSPYSAYSSYAGNPLLIDLDLLSEEGLIDYSDYNDLNWGSDLNKVDFDLVIKNKEIVLRKAFNNFIENDEYHKFCLDNAYWLEDYALFMAILKEYGNTWYEWPKSLKDRNEKELELFRNYSNDYKYHKVIQYLFYKQWFRFKEYANNNGIEIIGDIPIYVAYNSSDVWANRELFLLDEDGRLSLVAGCPPDGFTPDGQNWMNPLYNWNKLKEKDYLWWFKRITYSCEIYDILRIDHFIGYARYFVIPNPGKPKDGHYEIGPGIDFFNKLDLYKKDLPLIVEDLGNITDEVRDLLSKVSFPGMRLLEFGFDLYKPDDDYNRPSGYIENCVAYIGTHDSDTLKGWIETRSKEDLDFIMSFYDTNDKDILFDRMIESLFESKANTVILQAQDILRQDNEYRMNIPATETGNWGYRVNKKIYDKENIEKLKELAIKSKRI